jgi:rubrerythrin
LRIQLHVLNNTHAASGDACIQGDSLRVNADKADDRPDIDQEEIAMTNRTTDVIVPSRRAFLAGTSGLALSAAAVLMLAGKDSFAQAMGGPMAADIGILNVALGLEFEAINAYQLGAQSGLLQKPVLDVAVKFQSDHKGHRDALIATIQKMGGKPVEEKKLDDYAKALKADTLKSQADVLALAASLELGATNAYLGVIPAFKDAQLAKVAGRLAADETMHWTVLNNALGRALPADALPFGA